MQTVISLIGFDEDAGGSLPAPLVKLGSYSGANNARDFERSMKLPVVGSLKFKGVEFRGTY